MVCNVKDRPNDQSDQRGVLTHVGLGHLNEYIGLRPEDGGAAGRIGAEHAEIILVGNPAEGLTSSRLKTLEKSLVRVLIRSKRDPDQVIGRIAASDRTNDRLELMQLKRNQPCEGAQWIGVIRFHKMLQKGGNHLCALFLEVIPDSVLVQPVGFGDELCNMAEGHGGIGEVWFEQLKHIEPHTRLDHANAVAHGLTRPACAGKDFTIGIDHHDGLAVGQAGRDDDTGRLSAARAGHHKDMPRDVARAQGDQLRLAAFPPCLGVICPERRRVATRVVIFPQHNPVRIGDGLAHRGPCSPVRIAEDGLRRAVAIAAAVAPRWPQLARGTFRQA